jgi:hypothetical protein
VTLDRTRIERKMSGRVALFPSPRARGSHERSTLGLDGFGALHGGRLAGGALGLLGLAAKLFGRRRRLLGRNLERQRVVVRGQLVGRQRRVLGERQRERKLVEQLLGR